MSILINPGAVKAVIDIMVIIPSVIKGNDKIAIGVEVQGGHELVIMPVVIIKLDLVGASIIPYVGIIHIRMLATLTCRSNIGRPDYRFRIGCELWRVGIHFQIKVIRHRRGADVGQPGPGKTADA